MKLSLFKTEFPIMLAPMAGFTDMTYRSICREHGCDFTFTEMISAKGLKYGGKSADLMETAPNERPCGIQLFGRDPDIMAEMARRICGENKGELALIDINMGCPAPKITGNGEGSALMKEPLTAARVIEAVVKASDLPVSVKFRKGWDKPELLTPGKIEKYEMEMYFYGMVFKKGHKIRIDISSSELMEAFPNTNTGIDPYTDPKPIKATQTIYHGREYPSHVKLPVLYGL